MQNYGKKHDFTLENELILQKKKEEKKNDDNKTKDKVNLKAKKGHFNLQ